MHSIHKVSFRVLCYARHAPNCYNMHAFETAINIKNVMCITIYLKFNSKNINGNSMSEDCNGAVEEINLNPLRISDGLLFKRRKHEVMDDGLSIMDDFVLVFRLIAEGGVPTSFSTMRMQVKCSLY